MSEETAKPGLIKRLLTCSWRLFNRPSSKIGLGALLVIGAVSGVLFWGAFNWGLEMTNNEQFCITCHEMGDNVYVELQETVHFANRTGVRATCPDCHVPKEWGHKMIRKLQASNDLLQHILGTVDTPEKFEAHRLRLATNVWTAMKKTDSRECRNCHSFNSMDYAVQEVRSRERHQEAQDQGKTCIDCHKGIAHRLPKGAYEAEKQLNASMGK